MLVLATQLPAAPLIGEIRRVLHIICTKSFLGGSYCSLHRICLAWLHPEPKYASDGVLIATAPEKGM